MIRAFLSFATLVYIAAAYGVALLFIFTMGGGDLPSAFVWARNTALVIGVVIVGSFGFSFYHAPWRMLWRKFPKLNEWIFPDLNGVWLGATSSNWPKIDAMRKAAFAETTISDADIDALALKDDAIAFQIRAHWFGVTIRTRTHAVNGDSWAPDASPAKGVRGRNFELSYIYDQKTPQPAATDEGNHIGAATVEAKVGDDILLDGEYWTRRSWAQGLNTAGRLTLRRVSERHVSPSLNLLEEAERKAGENR